MEKIKVKRQINLPEIEKRKCKMCGVEYGINAKQKNKIYCNSCRVIANRESNRRYLKSERGRNKRKELYHKNHKEETHFNKCVLCGKEFLTKQGKAKYCIYCLEEKAETNYYYRNILERRMI